MPFAASWRDEEEQKNGQEQGGMNVSGESTTFSTGVPGQDASSKPQKGSGAKFANIQSYLDANQSQGNAMGEKIAGNVESAAQDSQAKTQSFSQAAPKVEAYDPNEAYSKLDQGAIGQAEKDKYNAAKAGYKGPQQLDQVQGYDAARTAAQTASAQVKNAGTEEGQRQLLKETYKRPSYTAGENALDQTIVQNSAGSKAAFEGLGQKYAGLDKMFDDSAMNVGNQVNQNIANGLQNQKAIADGEAAQRAALMDPIRQRAQEQTARNAELTGKIGADIADDTLSADTLAAIGLGEGQKLWDLSLSNYFTPDYTQVGVNNAATVAERQKYQALTDLIDGKAGSEITADGKAINPYGFDSARLAADIARKQQEFDAFAAGRGYAGRAGDSAYHDSQGAAIWNVDKEATANLADYLANNGRIDVKDIGQDLSRYKFLQDEVEQFNEAARQQVRDQVAADLARFGYNRQIKKG